MTETTNMKSVDATLLDRLKKAASSETAYEPIKWSEDNPLRGHCGAVSYVVSNLLGGEILQGRVNGEPHFWNRLPDGSEVDYTASQFGADCHYPIGRVAKPRKKINPRFIKFAEKVES
tara:strand:- start:284 stop:637 length:354 start_codon:yes stop_codon:yes gene_type:complete